MRNRKAACFEALVLEPHIAQILRPLLATLLPPWWVRQGCCACVGRKKGASSLHLSVFRQKSEKHAYRRCEFCAGFQANRVTWFLWPLARIRHLPPCIWSWSCWSVLVLLQAMVSCTCPVSLANSCTWQCPLVSWWVDLSPNSLPACTCNFRCALATSSDHQIKSSQKLKIQLWWNAMQMWMMKSLVLSIATLLMPNICCSCVEVWPMCRPSALGTGSLGTWSLECFSSTWHLISW